ncbi:YSIRK-type signal peptide-containing protein [Staphylococcus saccharolyticus]|nr:YSIRK-type signal peptide-containing protein [Staphylococcus saccharolyticus]
MNLFRKQKFSIRKFNIGIFSTLIATITFLAHPGQASASELNSTQENNNNNVVSFSTDNTQNLINADQTQNDPSTNSSDQTNIQSSENTQNNTQAQNLNDEHPEVQPANKPVAEITQKDIQSTTAPINNVEDNSETSVVHVNEPAKLHIDAHSEDTRNQTNHSQRSSVPESKATTEESTKPKKRSRRAVDTSNGNDTSATTTNTDPNISNTGQNSINTIITFDDLGIRTSTNRSRPEVKVVDSLSGFNLINGGKVGLLIVY